MTDQKAKPKGILNIIVAVLIFAGVTYYVVDRFIGTGKSAIDKELVQISNSLNEHAPLMINEETRFDNALAQPGKKLRYNLTMVNLTKDEVDIDALEEDKQIIITQIRTTPQLERARKSKITVIYAYYDKNGEFVHELTITPDMYQN